MEIVEMNIEALQGYEANAKAHPPEQVERIARSIEAFGFRNPVLVDRDGVIVAGHGRVMAARRLGLASVPVVRIDDLTPEQIRAYRIADNRLAESDWLDDILKGEIAALDASAVDLSLLGFDENELDLLLPPIPGETDPDDIPDLPEDVPPMTQPGDIWQLGDHRVMCGDCTDMGAVVRVMGGEKAELVLTDPPYGINRDEGFGGFGRFGRFGKPIPRRKYKGGWDDERPSRECFESILTMAKTAMIFGGNFFADLLPRSTHWIVWDKKNTMPSFGDAELIWTNVKKNSVKIKVFQYNGLLGKEKERSHPTQKPVVLICDLLDENSRDGQSVYDPFLGFGSTLIACERLGRVCYGMEIEPHYCDVIVKRWEEYTGRKAKR